MTAMDDVMMGEYMLGLKKQSDEEVKRAYMLDRRMTQFNICAVRCHFLCTARSCDFYFLNFESPWESLYLLIGPFCNC